MNTIVKLYSIKEGEINRFLSLFYNDKFNIEKDLQWNINFSNPIEIADIIGNYIDNNDKFEFNMWICLDEGFLINVTDNNADNIIRYLYERFPY